MTYITKTQMIR